MTHIDDYSRPPVILEDGTWRFAARIVRWTDGDTCVVDCLVDVGFEEMITKRRRIRLHGIDAPESRASDPAEREAGRAAKLYVQSQWREGIPVVVDVIGFDKYGGRDLGRITDVALVDIGQALVDAGHATPYDGGPR